MKSIFSFLVVAFFFFSLKSSAQNYSSNSLDKAMHFQNNQMFEAFIFSKLISNENDSISMLNKFSKDLRSELYSQKWNTVLNENNRAFIYNLSMIKVLDKDKINLFGNPLMGFTDKKIVFDEPALFSDTVLIYSF